MLYDPAKATGRVKPDSIVTSFCVSSKYHQGVVGFLFPVAVDGQEMVTGKLYKGKVNASVYEKVLQLSLNRERLQFY